MLLDDISDVGGTAITQLPKVSVENLMVFVVLREVLSHNFDEQFTNICFPILAIWWFEPHNLSIAISLSVLSIAVIEGH